jgi:alpha-L-fucosidase
MKRIATRSSAALALLLCVTAHAQGPEAPSHELKWFQDAKLGIFIHWGIYSVNGTDESWAFYNKKVGYADYMKQLQGFTAKQVRSSRMGRTDPAKRREVRRDHHQAP